ncbi:MAG: glycosyltransferase [Bacteroidetes bacterium]|jgi:glycosyltransferase involved in cell wall biosynthesis|nr:glycosyltransferase [Bacteroidota bacterium]MDF2451265.1 glycosyltransferase [Bacteroidota bacterium]
MISFIIPAYNASGALNNQLSHLIDYLKTNNIESEILIVDDGSRDGEQTKKVADKFGCKYLKNPVNMGKGAAVRNGMMNSTGAIKIFTDADIPFELDAMKSIIDEISINNYDMVVGDRTLAESMYHDQISKKRSIGSNFYSFIVARFISGGVFDTQCGLKAFKKEIADDIFGVSKLNSFAFDVELISIAVKRNYKIKKIPVKLRSQEGNSVSMLKHAPGMIADLFRIKWELLKGGYKKLS